MANSQFLPPEIDNGEHELNLRPDSAVHLSGDLSGTVEEGVFASLVSSVRDVFFPPKLPPLVLTSKPIAVPDRMAVKRDPKSTVIAAVVNGLILLLVLWWGARKVGIIKSAPVREISLVEPPPPLPKTPPKAVTMGGGGGQKGPAPVSKGNPPKFDPHPLVPPIAPPVDKPKISIEPTINVQKDIKMAKIDVPNLGMPNSPIVGTSMGNGNGSGLGSGNGNGMGPGSGGNTGGGVYHIGGGVSQPVVLYAPEPEFSEEARKAKVAGNVVVYLQVDPNGRPVHVRVIRGIGLGLDEKAMEAVRQYKFKPAMKDGKPVTVEMNVEVNFQIF
jgi:protein TonB